MLEVSDDGAGFDPGTLGGVAGSGQALPRPAEDAVALTGLGLAGMRERAELLGGNLELTSAPGRGTTVRLTVPFTPRGEPGLGPALPGTPGWPARRPR